MGLTPFACITLHDSVRIVYPDGHVDSLNRSCSVYELLLGNPDYYVCGSFPHSLANRMAADDVLQKGLTYFVCATPNAQPFHPRKSWNRPSRLLPRLTRRGMREMRSPTHHSKVFDVQSAAMQQQLDSLRGEQPPKHLQQLKIVFVRHCLQALRFPRMDPFTDDPAPFTNEAVVSAPAATSVDVLPVFKSAARSELGLYVSRRQEFYLRRARRRRKVVWKPVLQSISEMAPVLEFHLPVSQEENESASARFSPRAPPRKNISPPRQPVIVAAAPPKNISPPRQQPNIAKYSAAPLQQHQQHQQHQHHQQQRSRGDNRSLYMA